MKKRFWEWNKKNLDDLFLNAFIEGYQVRVVHIDTDQVIISRVENVVRYDSREYSLGKAEKIYQKNRYSFFIKKFVKKPWARREIIHAALNNNTVAQYILRRFIAR